MNISKVINSRDEKTNDVLGYIVTIDSQDFGVPLDSGNRHYQEIQKWVAEGNTIAEAD